MFDRCGLTRFRDDLLGCRDSLLLFALGQVRRAFTGFVDHLLRVGIGFRDNFLIALLRFSEFLFDFLGIDLAFLDLAPALLEEGQINAEKIKKELAEAEKR